MMTKRRVIALAGLGLLLTTGCPTKSVDDGANQPDPAANPTPAPAPDEPGPPPSDEPTERPTMTRAECTAQGGMVKGDIGDGAIHRPDYRCEDGNPPLATIRPEKGEPIATEGEVCCGTSP